MKTADLLKDPGGVAVSGKLIGEMLPGYRNGKAMEYKGFILIEYEPRDLRIKELADDLVAADMNPCLIYDYKGGIYMDSMDAYSFFKTLYGDGVELSDNDYVRFYDGLLVRDGAKYNLVKIHKHTKYCLEGEE